MISIANLLEETPLPRNYFASDVYVRGTLELGLLENRQGARLLALPDTLLKSIVSGLTSETGQASYLVLRNCGLWWGKKFYARFCDELRDSYQQDIADLPMVDFLQSLKACWLTHGWGVFNLNTTYHQQGFLVVEIQNSPFTLNSVRTGQTCGALESGILQSFFSQLTGRELVCVQTSCESLGANCNRFVLGIESRLESVESLVQQGQPHGAIMKMLTQAS